MAPITQASDESNHQDLLDKLDIYGVRKPFRKSSWKAPMRRNKNVKQIISEASRKEASLLATQNNSGVNTPRPEPATGDVTIVDGDAPVTDIAQAAQNLSVMATEKNTQPATATGPSVTYTNIESAPSLHPSSQRHYCDITGLPAPYTDPKTRLRYHNGQIFGVIRNLGQGVSEQYLAARGAHTVLK